MPSFLDLSGNSSSGAQGDAELPGSGEKSTYSALKGLLGDLSGYANDAAQVVNTLKGKPAAPPPKKLAARGYLADVPPLYLALGGVAILAVLVFAFRRK